MSPSKERAQRASIASMMGMALQKEPAVSPQKASPHRAENLSPTRKAHDNSVAFIRDNIRDAIEKSFSSFREERERLLLVHHCKELRILNGTAVSATDTTKASAAFSGVVTKEFLEEFLLGGDKADKDNDTPLADRTCVDLSA